MSKVKEGLGSLNCSKCDWEIEIPPEISEQLLRNDCPTCGSDAIFNSQSSKSSPIGFDFLPSNFNLMQIN